MNDNPSPPVLRSEIRRGHYCDSIVLMRLQVALSQQPDVDDAGAVMATAANLAILEANGLKTEEAANAAADDLLIVVRGESAEAVDHALAQVDDLLAERRETGDHGYRPHSLTGARQQLPEATWALISVPGRHATRVAQEALDHNLNLFLYSDNVSLDDELTLKQKASEKGLMMMGPDCGTAIVAGSGLGFANRVESGHIGLVGASGTGLQAIISHLADLGVGVSQALGTGGRDLKAGIGAITARQGLELLGRDPQTQVIVLVSKPPSPKVARRLLDTARATGKPVVIDFIGHPPPAERLDNLHFTVGLRQTAERAAHLFLSANPEHWRKRQPCPAREGKFLRGLFAGGTLAYEALQALQIGFAPLSSNIELPGVLPIDDPLLSQGHTVLDLGEDEFTVGRLHPMIDQDLRCRRLRQELEDPAVGWILLDVVLGDGAHPDPASELAPILEGRTEPGPEIFVIVVGTGQDPQGRQAQIDRFAATGARVFRGVGEAVDALIQRLPPSAHDLQPVALSAIEPPLAAINIGLETFYDSLIEQGARAVHVDWRPPAGGNEQLLAILDRMKDERD